MKTTNPDELSDIQEGIFVTEEGERLRGVTSFHVPIGEDRYVEAVLKKKTKEVAAITRQYAEDLEVGGASTYTRCGHFYITLYITW
jgi:hypothetical protein